MTKLSLTNFEGGDRLSKGGGQEGGTTFNRMGGGGQIADALCPLNQKPCSHGFTWATITNMPIIPNFSDSVAQFFHILL